MLTQFWEEILLLVAYQMEGPLSEVVVGLVTQWLVEDLLTSLYIENEEVMIMGVEVVVYLNETFRLRQLEG